MLISVVPVAVALLASTTAISGLTAPSQLATRFVPRYNTSCTTILPPPKSQICGVKGYVQYYPSEPPTYAAGNSSVPHISECRDLCALRSKLVGCSAFTYKASTGLCVLYSSSGYPYSFSENSSSPFEYYSQRCFHCPNQCPPENPKANLVDNSDFGFSDQLIGPWTYEGDVEVISPGHHSAHALKATDFLAIDQMRDSCAGLRYSFSVDIKITSPPRAKATDLIFVYLVAGQLEMSVQYFLNYTSGSSGAGYGSWRTFRATTKGRPHSVRGASATEFSVTFQNLNLVKGYTIYVSNFVYKPTQAEYQTIGEDLLTNGGFESGSIQPWEEQNYGFEKGYPHINRVVPYGLTAGSNYSLKYQAEEYQVPPGYEYCYEKHECHYVYNSDAGDDLGGLGISQSIATVPGQLYLLRFVFRVAYIDVIFVRIEYPERSEYPPISWQIPSDNMYNETTGSHHNFTTFSRVFEALSSNSSLILSFNGYGYEQKIVELVEIDDVSILALARGQSL